ncbi:MOSC domain-containing protein [Streptomyces orinoci]|uniref:MOSC N-terminal beta barrel domain-containing protein n=1 Tax=Streptomyces orinoci TaxID=67339 RepID=A0ABV3K040_STRON|nr:MOSC N-terminal beta barrel domain-containing protein [Streptomyces orinoci]
MSDPVPPVLKAIHFYPVKSMAGCAPGEAAVEPWGLAGDRRWMPVDADGRALTQRQLPRLALASARPAPGGGLLLTAPGAGPLEVAVPSEREHGTVMVELFRDKVEAVPAAPSADAWLSGYLGIPARLVYMDRPESRRAVNPKYALAGETVSFADGYPVLVTTTASLDALNSLIAQGDVPGEGPLPMNRFRPNLVVDGTAAWAEDGWRRLSIGELTFRVAKPCARCVITTTDQSTAERGREPLRTLARHRRLDAGLVFGQLLIPESTGLLRVGDRVEILG